MRKNLHVKTEAEKILNTVEDDSNIETCVKKAYMFFILVLFVANL